MKKIIFIVFVAVLIAASCKKTGIAVVPAISLNFANATGTITKALVKPPYGGYWSQLTGVNRGKTYVFTLSAGSSAIAIDDKADTTKPLYGGEIIGTGGSIYSLFLTGDGGNDALLIQDTIPSYTDSSFGVRFVNLSTYADPVSVNIQGNATTEATGLGYKGISSFKKYPASGDYFNNGYTYEFRDASTHSLIASYYLTPPVFRSTTLVLYSPGGTHQVMVMNNY